MLNDRPNIVNYNSDTSNVATSLGTSSALLWSKVNNYTVKNDKSIKGINVAITSIIDLLKTIFVNPTILSAFIDGYLRIGKSAPKIAMKKLTRQLGSYGMATEVAVAHELDSTKILYVTAVATGTTNGSFPPFNDVAFSGHDNYYIYFTTTDIILGVTPTSSDIQNHIATITIIYEE